MSVVDYQVDGHVALVTLNRPEAKNAINPEVAVRLHDAWQAVKEDDQVRVAVIHWNRRLLLRGCGPGPAHPVDVGCAPTGKRMG